MDITGKCYKSNAHTSLQKYPLTFCEKLKNHFKEFNTQNLYGGPILVKWVC